MRDKYKFLITAAIFLLLYYLPFGNPRLANAILEAFLMLQEYARQHVLLCLVPAFFIAGAISVFVSQASVMKYFGPRANKVLAYSVASVSGTILAVCSCTVLPLFAGIYTKGAGIGPAAAFLYSGPAINVLAIILSARILGIEMGVARAAGAVFFSVVIGLIMAFIYKREEAEKERDERMFKAEEMEEARPLWKTALYFLNLVLILIFATWGRPKEPVGFFNAVYKIHWPVAAALLLSLFYILKNWFQKDELKTWVDSTWVFAWQIFPLLLGGVFVAGLLMGRPGLDNGLIPNRYVAMLVGGNSLWANFFASISGALMYFAT
ncbi:MAG TPA: permease, partial [bacterium]|nr:permease [bacterium]